MRDEKTQREYVVNALLKRGYITRNEALSKYISRLSGIIYILKDAGWDFKTENVFKRNAHGEVIGTDFKYTATKIPQELK